jgi:hypothetical protein
MLRVEDRDGLLDCPGGAISFPIRGDQHQGHVACGGGLENGRDFGL